MSQADDLQQRVEDFADRTIELVQALPGTIVAQRIGSQLLDASTSAAANYRAARRGRSYAEFTAKMGIVSEESDEAVFWLNRLRKARVATSIALEPLLAEGEELARIFGSAARTARRRRGKLNKSSNKQMG